MLKEKLRGDSPTHYLERRVLHRLGLGSQRYLTDSAGNPLLAAGWILNAREWAKLGQLVLANGPPVVSPNSLAQCWRGTAANHAFSLGWWNNRAAPNGREFDFEQMLIPKWQNQDWHDACLCRDAPTIWSPASVRRDNVFMLFRRSNSSWCGKPTAAHFRTRTFCGCCLAGSDNSGSGDEDAASVRSFSAHLELTGILAVNVIV